MILRQFRTTVETGRQWGNAAGYALRMMGRPLPLPPAPGRRMLVVSRYLPPHFHGGSLRQLALLRALCRTGWAVDALTETPGSSPSPAGLELMHRLPDGLRIHRWTPPATAASTRFSPRLSGGFSSISRILDTASSIPETPSIVLASGPPFAEFVAAGVLARRYRVPCVLDYRDEWTTSTFAFVERGSGDVHWERRSIKGATAVVFATDTMRTHYLRTFPTLAASVTTTIRNGWDDTGAFGLDPAPPALDASRPATVGFFGFLGEHWDFEEFTRTLAAAVAGDPSLADTTRFAVYGKVSQENQAAVEALARPSLFGLHGLVPHGQAQRTMASCDALIVFNSQRLARVLPGKIFEYIASRRPVLLYGDGGEMEEVLRDIPGTTIVRRGDAPGLLAALHRIAAGSAAAEIAAAPREYPEVLHRSHRDQEWIHLLDSLVGGAA
jgi:glycosyltransferase involved in cell wall biosynthesis